MVRPKSRNSSLRGELAPGPWLRRVALRVWLDLLRKSRRGPRRAEGAEVELVATGDAVAEHARALAAREELDRLLARLAPLEREVLERFHRAGHSIARIAVELELAEGTVKSHLHRARRRLAEAGPGHEAHEAHEELR